MASREEKHLEAATEMMLLRINEMKMSLTNLLMRIEHDHQNISFPDVLDAFAVISGQVNCKLQESLPGWMEVDGNSMLLFLDECPDETAEIW